MSEVNTIPGFTEISMYAKLWQASGLPFPQLLRRLLDLARERHRTRPARRVAAKTRITCPPLPFSCGSGTTSG